MKKLYFIIFIATALSFNACQNVQKDNIIKQLPHIAIAGLAIESSTFSSVQSNIEDFRTLRGDEVFSYYPFLSTDSLYQNRDEWISIVRGHAIPEGIVMREAYESLVNETLDSLKLYGSYVGLFFDIHGAMSVIGLDDPEGDFIIRIRKVVGKNSLISTSMDLHGNVTWPLAQNNLT